jgi:acetyl esterase/lipase
MGLIEELHLQIVRRSLRSIHPVLAARAKIRDPDEGPNVTDDDSVLTRAAAAPDLTVAYASAAEQIADIRLGGEGADRRPLVVLIHGGFWRPAYDRAHSGPMSAALASAGWTVATIEYQRVPGQPDLTLQDVRRAVEVLPALSDRHNGHLVLVGHSAGGHLVLWASATASGQPITGVLALAPAADLELAHQRGLGDGAVRAFLGADPRARPDVDPKLLPTPKAAVTIVHGTRDDVVPPEISRSYVAVHPDARLVELPEADHFAVIDPLSAAWATVVAELRRLSRL